MSTVGCQCYTHTDALSFHITFRSLSTLSSDITQSSRHTHQRPRNKHEHDWFHTFFRSTSMVFNCPSEAEVPNSDGRSAVEPTAAFIIPNCRNARLLLPNNTISFSVIPNRSNNLSCFFVPPNNISCAFFGKG